MSAHVAVAGAGLGGLTLALSLLRAGFRVTVLEQARRLGEVGAGVQISANGSRVLHALGLAPALDRVAFRPEAGEVRHWRSGEVLVSRPLGASSIERFGFPYYHLHRADLHDALAAAVRARAPDAIRLGARVEGFDDAPGGVRVRLADGTGVDADALIGCDGIHSRVRELLFGPDAPRFTGCVAWRATIPVERLPPGHVRPVSSNWLGEGGHFVHYYLRRGTLVNCVGCTERDEWIGESWSAEGDPRDFARDFAGWHEALQALVRSVERCFRWGLFDREPLPRWSEGRVTLLGDACHPMLPFMAQGAVMSIEDACVLTRCLAATPGDVAGALARYEGLRRERTAGVQQMSRDNIALFHHVESASEEALRGHRSRHEWLYAYDATAVETAAA